MSRRNEKEIMELEGQNEKMENLLSQIQTLLQSEKLNAQTMMEKIDEILTKSDNILI